MDRQKALTWTELRVGVVVILSLFVLSLTILYVGGGGAPLAPKYTVKALMTDVNGLKPGAPVRLGGVEVGTVKKVSFPPAGGGGMVEVSMRLDQRVKDRITTTSQVGLGALGLLGEKAVDISASPHGTPIDDGGYLPSGGEDPMKGLLTDASDSMTHFRRILARIDAGQGLVGKTLRDEELYERMVDVSIRLQHVMDKFETNEGPLGRLVNDRGMSQSLQRSAHGIDTLVARIEAGQGTLGVLSKDEGLASDLRNLTQQLGEISRKLRAGEGTAGRMLQDDSLYKRMDETTQRLSAVLDRLDRGEGTAGRLMKDPEMYNNLSGALKDFRDLIGEIRRDPRKYLRVKLSLF